MRKYLIFSLLAYLISACASESVSETLEPIKPRALYHSAFCGTSSSNSSFTVVNNVEQLTVLLQQLQRRMLGGTKTVPHANFEGEHVLLLEMGQARTSGYAVTLSDADVRIVNGEAIIKIHWQIPVPGRQQAQVITSPCLIFALPKSDYTAITVTDMNNSNRHSIQVVR